MIKMMKGIIYKYTNTVNGKCYIGKTTNAIKRKWSHLHDRRHKSLFHNALDKYGINQFNYEVLIEFISKDKDRLDFILNYFEKYYIKKYESNKIEKGYNLTNGGDGVIGRFGELNPFYGKHHSEENKLRHSNRMKGRNASDETKLKMSESQKKIVHTKEWNYKVGLANQKSVRAFKDGVLVGKYKCYKDCIIDLNLPNIKGISKVINGKNKTYDGYTFQLAQNTIENNTDKEENK